MILNWNIWQSSKNIRKPRTVMDVFTKTFNHRFERKFHVQAMTLIEKDV